MQAPFDPIVPRESSDGLFLIGTIGPEERALMREARIRELRDAIGRADHMLHTLPTTARRFGAGDDLARLRDRRQRELDALLREAV